MKRTVLFSFFGISFFFLHTLSFSQEYNHEIGAAVGTSFYMGDANKTKLFLHSGIAGGGVYRYNINLNWALKGNLLVGTISGNTKEAQNIFPHKAEIAFKRTFAELGGQIEYNFFPYSNKYGYQNTKPYTPYLLVGMGITLASGRYPFWGINTPVGIGFKYKLKNRINIGIEFSMRKLFRDDLDVTDKKERINLNAPYNIKSSFLKNQDWYSLSLFFLTWEFGLKEGPCK